MFVPCRSLVQDAGLAQDLEVVTDGRLADGAALGEVTGADAVALRQLANDRQPYGIGEGGQGA